MKKIRIFGKVLLCILDSRAGSQLGLERLNGLAGPTSVSFSLSLLIAYIASIPYAIGHKSFVIEPRVLIQAAARCIPRSCLCCIAQTAIIQEHRARDFLFEIFQLQTARVFIRGPLMLLLLLWSDNGNIKRSSSAVSF